MPGNEKEVIEFIVNNRSQLNLPMIGAINKIEIPRENRLEEITNIEQLYNFYSDDKFKICHIDFVLIKSNNLLTKN